MGLKKLEKRKIVERPRSLGILVIIKIFQGLVLLGFGVFQASQFGWGWAWEGSELVFTPLVPYSVIDLAYSGLLYLILAIITLFIALELWLVRRWAWLAAMTLQGLSLLAALFGYLQGQPNYISMALGIVLVLYLNQAEVQAVFRRSPKSA